MRIKDIKGLVITGHMQIIEDIQKNNTHSISFTFKNLLNDGDYLFNCGINNHAYGEIVKLHRVIDAIIFKTVYSYDTNSRGIVDFGFQANNDILQTQGDL